MPYTIGLDYGTNFVRCLVVDIAKQMHDGFGITENTVSMASVMKELLNIKENCRG